MELGAIEASKLRMQPAISVTMNNIVYVFDTNEQLKDFMSGVSWTKGTHVVVNEVTLRTV